MIRIDGSFGEGGGQILRTSLSLPLQLERHSVLRRFALDANGQACCVST